jgi:hypothetical protein
MSTGSITDALSRITAIEQQMQQLSSGSLLDSQLGISSDSSSSSSSSTAATQTADTGSTDFANALAQAQNPASTSATDATSETDPAAVSSAVPSDDGASFGSLADSALASASPTASTMSLLTGGVAPSAGATLPAAASTALTSSQQQFASTLSADTGLNPSVVTAWLLSEESGGAAQTRQAAGNNDWLNVGYTDSATFGAQDPVWSDPVTAANATAQWLQGQNSVAGYGTASAGVQGILQSVGQTPAAQVQAIQNSGWASGGYPDLMSRYEEVSGADAIT